MVGEEGEKSMNDQESALAELAEVVFNVLVSGDKQRIEEIQAALDRNGLQAIWCQSPLRIEPKSSESSKSNQGEVTQ